LARALDVVGERWTLVIVQELQKRPTKYGDLKRRLPGIGTSVLADRLRKLEAARILGRRAGPVGEGVVYELTERGRSLEAALRALREWGAEFLFDPDADGASGHTFDLGYVDGFERIPGGSFQVTVDDRPTALTFRQGELTQRSGAAPDAEITIDTSMGFLRRWAAGDVDWDAGVADNSVRVEGSSEAWLRWLVSSGYLPTYQPEDEQTPDPQ
jgi:DNA-binding HxlR family transcriptional regulator